MVIYEKYEKEFALGGELFFVIILGIRPNKP